MALQTTAVILGMLVLLGSAPGSEAASRRIALPSVSIPLPESIVADPEWLDRSYTIIAHAFIEFHPYCASLVAYRRPPRGTKNVVIVVRCRAGRWM